MSTEEKTLIVGRDNGGDEMLNVSFYEMEVKNNFQSKKKGEDVYDTVEMVRIQIPGDNMNVVEREASEFDKRRFRIPYESFRMSKEGVINGTPLEKLGFKNDLINDMHNIGFMTVEQLANASDAILQKKMGGIAWRQRAIDYLRKAADSVNIEANAKIEQQQQEINDLKEMVAKLAEKGNNATRDDSPKKRGRKPKGE